MATSRIQAWYQNPKKHLIWPNSVIRHGQGDFPAFRGRNGLRAAWAELSLFPTKNCVRVEPVELARQER
jgi:hypothetical protein